MAAQYVIGIDQSTQGTKALLIDEKGSLLYRCDRQHQQIINDRGWVSHDLEEIYHNTIEVVKKLLTDYNINPKQIAAIGISNQRETTAAWNRTTGKPVEKAIVWQCARATEIAKHLEKEGYAEQIREKTGIPLSPYFPASKMAWFIGNNSLCQMLMKNKQLCLGTMDSWLVYKMTGGKVFKTDYSNASRYQLFNLHSLKWDQTLCELFGIDSQCLPEVCDSNAFFGETTLEGIFAEAIPIHAVMGDSHAALYGQGCHSKGMVKATYGTGSSVMMNVGEHFIKSHAGLSTSLAWSRSGKIEYVLEGNINYTGAVITWLKDSLQLIKDPNETEELANQANSEDETYIIPAFSGLGAPYWKSESSAAIVGMTRATTKKEIVKAAVECIGYQIADVIYAMEKDIGLEHLGALCVDGGPTKNTYLMQFQSNITNTVVQISKLEELSGIGAAYMAGVALNVYQEEILFNHRERVVFKPNISECLRNQKYSGWKKAIEKVI